MTITVCVSCDTAAIAVGADRVAAAIGSWAIARHLDVRIVRTGSRGLLWLEPLVEVCTGDGRIAYGPVQRGDVPSLLDAGFLEGGAHPLRLGSVEELPEFRRQQRVRFARCGLDEPLAAVPWHGLRSALALAPEAIVRLLLEAGLSPNGPTQPDAARKFIVCDADEGGSGTFADRMLIEGDPFLLIEGMAIAAHAVGASRGVVRVRAEYRHAAATFEAALHAARMAGALGPSMFGSGAAFDISLCVVGVSDATAPSKAAEAPALVGAVRGFASVPASLERGGVRAGRTWPFQLAGNVRRGGLFELPLGISLRELVFDIGGGTHSGQPVKTIHLGGARGGCVPESQWDLPLDEDACAALGLSLGDGAIVVHDECFDLVRSAPGRLATPA